MKNGGGQNARATGGPGILPVTHLHQGSNNLQGTAIQLEKFRH
jgi:hypothetical protein